MIFRLKLIFLSMVLIGSLYIIYNIYNNWQFKNKPLDKNMEKIVTKKRDELISQILELYGIYLPVPVKIENLPNKFYGLTILSHNNSIEIILNRKMFQESFNYIIDTVLPHEFAHAIMFYKGEISGDGHSSEWKEICIQLRGQICDQYVNNKDIIIEKLF